MDEFNRVLFVYFARALCLLFFLSSAISVTFSWKALVTGITFVCSIYFLRISKSTSVSTEKDKKTKDILKDLYPSVSNEKLQQEFKDTLVKMVKYDPEATPALDNFEVIKSKSNCLFARKAKIWGCPIWKEGLSLEEYMYRQLPTFLEFTIVCQSKRLDAFLVELPGDKYGSSIEDFGKGINTILRTMSDHDPAGIHCMNKSYIDKRGWVFEFNKCTFFITTFAPFYPSSHPRYSFEAENCYILFQPEVSFALHDLPPNSVETNWNEPQTVRDKIRIAFRDAGRPVYVPDSIFSPIVNEILTPVQTDDPLFKWWEM